MRLLAALIFFTRLPFWRIAEVPPRYYKEVVNYWPLVGWLTGGVMAGILWLTSHCFSWEIAVLLTMLSRILLTGALHEDGLADFCDGFGGGTTRERILSIMKDSHIGTYGVIGLICYLGMFYLLIYRLPMAIAPWLIVGFDTWSKITAKTENKRKMENKTELILIRISGLDRPGLTASITAILSEYDVDIMDIGQADIHSTLSLGLLFKCKEKDSGNIMKDLLFKASALGINIRFYPISTEEYEEWVNMQGKNRYILTLLGRKLTAQQIAGATRILAEQQLNIDGIRRLTGRIPLDEKKANVRACIEFSVRGTPKDKEELQRQLMQLSSSLAMDFSFQQDNMYRRMRRLICFDMDSTLIETEVIDELAMRAGVGDQVKAITERAMRGEIDFIESFKERVSLLKGLDESVMREIAENLPITEGVERLMYVLKRYGYKIAILSGGFTYFGNYLKDKFGIDYVYANELEIIDGKLTGRYLGDIVDGKRKAELLRLIAQVEKVDIAQTIAVGDGANDLPMLSIAGLGIAFHAKPKVAANARQSINTIGLDGVLYFLGFKDSYLDERGKL